MTRIGTIKKKSLKCVGQKSVSLSHIYMTVWPEIVPIVLKYHETNGHPMQIYNCPIYSAALYCVQHGRKVFDHIDDLNFVKMNCEYYKNNSQKYKVTMVRRLRKIIKSIRKNGYAAGNYNARYSGLRRGVSPLFGAVNGYEIVSGKHRIAAAAALGYKSMVCDIWININVTRKSNRGI